MLLKIRTRAAKEGPGEALALHFKVLRELGSGSFSKVYEVERRADQQRYALKQVDLRSIGSQELADLINETRLLAALDHPNLVQFFEAFVDRDQLFIITELVEHGALSAMLKQRADREELLPEWQVWSFFLQLCCGLRHLHQHEVVHRDLSAKNILLGEEGVVKIADLGLSRRLVAGEVQELAGTPEYVAPETWRREPASAAADIWSLGCVLHELCTLRPLFSGQTVEEVRSNVLDGLPGPLPKRYSLDLYVVVRRLLDPDPARRPTLDQVLAWPELQHSLEHMEERLPASLYEGSSRLGLARGDQGALLEQIQASRQSGYWGWINDLLPPHKYARGPGVAETLPSPSAGTPASLAGSAGGTPGSPGSLGIPGSPASQVIEMGQQGGSESSGSLARRGGGSSRGESPLASSSPMGRSRHSSMLGGVSPHRLLQPFKKLIGAGREEKGRAAPAVM